MNTDIFKELVEAVSELRYEIEGLDNENTVLLERLKTIEDCAEQLVEEKISETHEGKASQWDRELGYKEYGLTEQGLIPTHKPL